MQIIVLLSCENKLRYTFVIDLLNNNYVTCEKQPFRGSNYQLNMCISNHYSEHEANEIWYSGVVINVRCGVLAVTYTKWMN